MTTNTPMTVRARLSLGFCSILVLMLVVAATGIYRLGSLNTQLTTISNDRVPKIIIATDWLFRVMEAVRHTRNMLILDEDGKVKTEVEAVMDDKKASKEFMEQLQASVVTEEGKAALKEVIDARAAYTPAEDDYLRLIGSGDKAGAKTVLLQTVRPLQLTYVASLRKFIDSQKSVIHKSQVASTEEYTGSRALMVGVTLLGLLIGGIAAWMITRSLNRQLGGEPAYAAAIADRIAAGDLGVTIDTRAGDQSSMLYSMQRMRDSLCNIVTEVRLGTDTIATASNEIAAGNLDLSARTEQQASSLEETASSMEEMTSTVKQNAENSRQANQLAASASQVAVKGGAVVAQVVQTMGEINDSSRKIVDIISVIDGIAFQTNILALNAAVEAARAGEQGRGFAVVATEVRNLAQRSAAAAKEIKLLIGDSVDKVDFGSKLVGEAGSTMDEIVISVQRVTDNMDEISTASREQEAGIEQINQAISQMDTVTQQNAALVEEAAAAAGSMQEQASKLAAAVSVFKLDLGAGAAPARLAAVAPRAVQAPRPAARPTRQLAAADAWEEF